MKKVIGMLAVVAFASSMASAELLKNFKYDGKVEVNAFTTNDADDANSKLKDRTSDVDTRVQLNMGFDLNEDANAVVSIVKNDRQHGEGSQNVHGLINMLNVEQAYLNLKGVMGFDHKVGRQYYGNEGDLVVYYGPKGWPYMSRNLPVVTIADNAMPVSALDAYTGWYKTGKWDFHGVAGKLANDNLSPNTDTNLTGVVAKYALREEVNLGAYVYEQKMYSAVSANLTLDVVGVKANGKVAGFDYTAEFAKNYGRQAAAMNYTGSAFRANAKYGHDFLGKWTFMGEYAMGSGDKKTTDKKNSAFNSIASDYRPGLFWGSFAAGLNGATPNTGLTTWNVGATWTPEKQEKLELGAKYVYLAPTEDKVDGVTIGYDKIGTEFDLSAAWKHSETVKVIGYLAYFTPDKKFATNFLGATKHDPATMLGAAFNVKF